MKGKFLTIYLYRNIALWSLVLLAFLFPFSSIGLAQPPSSDTKIITEGLGSITADGLSIPFYPHLNWSSQTTELRTLSLEGYSDPISVNGSFFQSDPFIVVDKPPVEILNFYFPEQIKNFSWNNLGFLDKPDSIGMMYQHTKVNRYLVIFIEECLTNHNLETLDSKNYCVKIWVSDTLPQPHFVQSYTYNLNTLFSFFPSPKYSNPLPVPFFSQRNSDPNDNIILGFGSSCTTTIHDSGCALTAHTMIYDYYQANFTTVIDLNNSMKVAPGVYSCSGNCCNLWPVSAPDAPSGVSFGQRYTNNCTTANCIDSGNVSIIDNEISSGRPMHVRVHPVGGSYNSHSVVIIGHSGSDYFIKDPWATDDTQRTLTNGALGQYVVDFIDTINGTPPSGGSCPGPSLISPSDGYISNSQTVSFSWNAPSGCTYSGYTFRVKDTANMESGGTTIYDEGQGGTSVTKTFDTQWNNKDLYWGVRTANPLSPNWSVRRFRIEPSSPSCSPSSNQVSLFVNSNYGGECITKNVGEYSNPSSIGLPNDAISSLKVGSDVQALLCKDDNYSGGCETFTIDDADLSNNSIGDNQVSSLKVISDVSTEHPIQLYKDADYNTGYCYTDSAGWFNLDGACDSYNDQISSFKLQSGWSVRFYKDLGLIGSNQCFTAADSNLSDNNYTDGTGMNDTISSVYLYNQSTCPPLIVPPSAPTLASPVNNAVLERTTNLTLSWNSVSGATEYYAEFWGGPSQSLNSGWTASTSWLLGSQWGGVYQWRVKARNSAGESGWSETRTLTIKYGAPTNLTAIAVSTSQINLSWGASADAPGNIDGYRIYRNNSAIATVGSSTTTYSDSSLSSGTTYSYYVKAYKVSIESDPSNTASATTSSPTCYSLNISISPSSTGTVGKNPAPNCNGTQYTSGSMVQLTATPAANYTFASWSGDLSSTSNPVSITMNGNKNVTATFNPTGNPFIKLFLPSIVKSGSTSGSGINGRVLFNGTPIGGISLNLRYYNGSAYSTLATTTTQSDGTYSFTGAPTLGTGAYYYVLYSNSSDSTKLNVWMTPLLETYSAGSNFQYNDFDIQNVVYSSPTPSASVPLPTTFTWTRRTSSPTDSYEFNLLDWSTFSYLFWTGPIGYVNSYNLTSLPSGMVINTPYGWEIWIYSPDGGIGIAYYVRQVYFSSAGKGEILESILSAEKYRIIQNDEMIHNRQMNWR